MNAKEWIEKIKATNYDTITIDRQAVEEIERLIESRDVDNSVNKQLYNKALKKYGLKMQLIVAIEELSELAKEICKVIRNKCNINHLIEEIADVEIMIEQLRCFYELGLSVEIVKKEKLERLKKRLNDE